MPAIKQQDRQVTKDDLDKDKNKDAAVLAGLVALGLGEGDPYPLFDKDKDGKLVLKDGKVSPTPFTVSYKAEEAVTGTVGDAKDPQTLYATPTSVVSPHGIYFMFIQACIAILILVGFESVTSMGEEAKNRQKRRTPAPVLLSLAIQGGILLSLFEYFGQRTFMPYITALLTHAPTPAPPAHRLVT